MVTDYVRMSPSLSATAILHLLSVPNPLIIDIDARDVGPSSSALNNTERAASQVMWGLFGELFRRC